MTSDAVSTRLKNAEFKEITKHRMCYSVQNEIDMYELLDDIIFKDICKEDYETVIATLYLRTFHTVK